MDKQYFLDKLNKTRQVNFQRYNYDLLPEIFKATDKVPIECYKHDVFYQEASSHLFGRGCPVCAVYENSTRQLLTTEMFINKSRLKFSDKFDYSKTNYTKKENDLTITCPIHGDFVLRANAHMWSKHGCPRCDYEIPREISKRKYLEKAKKNHNDKYNYSQVNFINASSKVEIICPTHGSFWQNFNSHVDGSVGCPQCALEANKFTLEQFIAKSKVIHGDIYDYSKVKYITNASMVIITCKDHGDFIQRAASHLAGCKCRKCFIEKNKKSTEEFIKDASLIHGNIYNYSKVKYYGNKKPVEIICPTHGSFWQKPNTHISSKTGCRYCSESKGERSVELFLKKYNIKYIREYRLLPHRYRSDFYLPGLNIHIEFNGVQHYTPVEMFGGELAYLKTKENDEIKKQFIKQNNEHLIIITYLNLSEDSVEKELIRQLKNVYKFWFVIKDCIKVFKIEMELYKFFNIPLNVLLKNVVKEVAKVVSDFRVLF